MDGYNVIHAWTSLKRLLSTASLEAARDDTRLFAIFLDDYHTRRGASVSVRDPIAKFASFSFFRFRLISLLLRHQSADLPGNAIPLCL